MPRPAPIYDRKKNVRTWKMDNEIKIESYFEDAVHFIIVSINVDLETKTILNHNIQFFRCPYPELCPLTAVNYIGLNGLVIEKGFNKTVKNLLQVEKSCVHIESLLRDCADAFTQTLFKLNAKDLDGKERRKWLRQSLRNVCLAYSDLYNQD